MHACVRAFFVIRPQSSTVNACHFDFERRYICKCNGNLMHKLFSISMKLVNHTLLAQCSRHSKH